MFFYLYQILDYIHTQLYYNIVVALQYYNISNYKAFRDI